MNLKFVLADCQDQQAGNLCSPELGAESKHEAVGLMKRCPAQDGDVIEILQVAGI